MKLNLEVNFTKIAGNPTFYKLANVEYSLMQITKDKCQLYNNTGKIADYNGNMRDIENEVVTDIEKNFLKKLEGLR